MIVGPLDPDKQGNEVKWNIRTLHKYQAFTSRSSKGFQQTKEYTTSAYLLGAGSACLCLFNHFCHHSRFPAECHYETREATRSRSCRVQSLYSNWRPGTHQHNKTVIPKNFSKTLFRLKALMNQSNFTG